MGAEPLNIEKYVVQVWQGPHRILNAPVSPRSRCTDGSDNGRAPSLSFLTPSLESLQKVPPLESERSSRDVKFIYNLINDISNCINLIENLNFRVPSKNETCLQYVIE